MTQGHRKLATDTLSHSQPSISCVANESVNTSHSILFDQLAFANLFLDLSRLFIVDLTHRITQTHIEICVVAQSLHHQMLTNFRWQSSNTLNKFVMSVPERASCLNVSH